MMASQKQHTTSSVSEKGKRTSRLVNIVMHPIFPLLVLSIGVLIRLLVAIFFPVEPMSDSSWYVARALDLSSGHGYQEGGIPTAYWPVGWPAILAAGYLLFDSIPVTVVVLNLAGAITTMLLVLWFGRNIAGSELVGRVALLAYAIYPNHIVYTGVAATEIVYTSLAMGAFALLIYGRKNFWLLALSGCIFGLATLVKPQTLGFPFGVIIALALVYKTFSWPSALRAGFIVYLTLLVVVLPWSYRNLTVFGEFVLVSTNGGTALILGANDQITGSHFDYEKTPVFKQLGIPRSERVARQVELDNKQKQMAIHWIKNNTLSYLSWMPRKVYILWLKDTDGFWSFDHSYPGSTLIVRTAQVINQAYYAFVLLLALACTVVALLGLVRKRDDIIQLGLLFCMPAFISIVAAVFTGQIRYHFAAMPFIFVAAAWALLNIPKMRKLATTL